MRRVIKKGYADWDDLKGKEICVSRYDGWDDFGYDVRMIFSQTQVYAEDPRYPRYYILDEDLGGVSFWEDEEVEVTVLD